MPLSRKDFFAAALGAGALGLTRLRAEDRGVVPMPTDAPTPLDDLLTLDDFEARAKMVLPQEVFSYVSTGAADQITLRWNREKYREIVLAPRVLNDVSHVDCTTTLFGKKLRMPILLAPTSNHRMVHPDGELGTARGAGMAGATMVLSSGANTSIEGVIRVATQPVWFQLYLFKDQGLTKELVQRVQQAGAQAICVTVDSPVDGPRNEQDRHKMVLPPNVGYPHYVGARELPSKVTLNEVIPAKLDWRDIEWLRGLTRVKLLLKGVTNPLDADRAIAIGADGIVVSNHGGRCLDTQPATIQVLPRVTAKVAGRVPVIVDGGIRRGTDLIKALAFGASAVQIGRPYLYGLASGGAEGVARVIKLLRQELLLDMALMGRPNIASIDRSVIWS